MVDYPEVVKLVWHRRERYKGEHFWSGDTVTTLKAVASMVTTEWFWLLDENFIHDIDTKSRPHQWTDASILRLTDKFDPYTRSFYANKRHVLSSSNLLGEMWSRDIPMQRINSPHRHIIQVNEEQNSTFPLIGSYQLTMQELLAEYPDSTFMVSGNHVLNPLPSSWLPELWEEQYIHKFGSDIFWFNRYSMDKGTKQHKHDTDYVSWPTLYKQGSFVEPARNTHPRMSFYTSEISNNQPVANFWQYPTPSIAQGNTGLLRHRLHGLSQHQDLYSDYPIEKRAGHPGLCDVIFLHQDEPGSMDNWNRLREICPRAKKVHGVNNRATSYKMMAEISDTTWFYAVFAKLQVDPDFSFDNPDLPDRLQRNKHYIFWAKNPVNDLIYGHQAIILYHKGLIQGQNEWGLDYTLSAPHATVPILSGVAKFDTTPFDTWKTAFREAVKLTLQSDKESQDRLNTWMTVARGEMAEWCLAGAREGNRYALDNFQDMKALQETRETNWLRLRFQRSR